MSKKQRGVVTQKMTTFRLDNDNDSWLNGESEKQGVTRGRLINNIIEQARLNTPATDKEKQRLQMALEKIRGTLLEAAIMMKELMNGLPHDMEEGEPPTLTDIFDRRP